MDPIKVYELDKQGVVIDDGPLGNEPGTLTKAQNAIPEPNGESGCIVKRPGWKKFTDIAGSSKVGGGIGVPLRLGSAGISLQNPFTNVAFTMLTLAARLTAQDQAGNTTPLGATFNDDSFIFSYDPVGDYTDDRNESELDDIDSYLVTDDAIDAEGAAEPSTLVPVTYIGSGKSFGARSDPDALVAATLVTTADGVRVADVVSDDVQLFPTDAIRNEDFDDPTTPLYGFLQNTPLTDIAWGRTTANLGSSLYYISDTYTVGTDYPPIRAFNGLDDRVVCRAPANPSVSASTPPNAIMTILAANAKIYFTTFDTGTNNTGGGTIKGSAYEFDPTTGVVTRLGTTFPTGHMPYTLTWLNGRLWVGTAINSNGDTTAGRVYWIRPGIDTSWTLDKTFATGEHFVSGLESLNGELYAAILGIPSTGLSGAVYKRSVLGTWSRINVVPPTVAPTPVAVAGGSLINGHFYVFKYTYYNSTALSESAGSLLFAGVGAAGANLTARVGVTASAEAGVTNIRLYARDVTAGEGVFKLQGTYTNTTTTHDVTVSNWSAAAELKEYEIYTDIMTWPPNEDAATSPTRAIYATTHVYVEKNSLVKLTSGLFWSDPIVNADWNAVGVGLGYSYAVNASGSIVPVLWLTNSVTNNGHIYNSTDGTTFTNRTIGFASGSTPTDEFVCSLFIQV